MKDTIDKSITAPIIIKTTEGDISFGVAKLKIEGDIILDSKRIELLDFNLICKKGGIIYERR